MYRYSTCNTEVHYIHIKENESLFLKYVCVLFIKLDVHTYLFYRVGYIFVFFATDIHVYVVHVPHMYYRHTTHTRG